MAPFVITHRSELSPDVVWARLTDWPRHGEFVPFTTVEVRTAAPTGVGTVFSGRTGFGRLAFEDPMEVVVWQPPGDGRSGRCRLEKRGRVVLGWAELSVTSRGSGSEASWQEEVLPAHLPSFAARPSAAIGKLFFARVLRRLVEDEK